MKLFRKAVILLFLITVSLFSSTNLIGQNLDQIRTAQQVNATKLVKQLERSDTSSISKYFSAAEFSKNANKISIFFKLFGDDFRNLPENNRRYPGLVFPAGLNTVTFSYIVEKIGILLQVEISYKDGDINSKVVHLSLKGTKAYNQEKKTNREAAYDFDLAL